MRPQALSFDEILRLFDSALLPSWRRGRLNGGHVWVILILVCTVFPASGSWNVPSPPSENPQLLLRRFVPGPLLRGGSSASSSLGSSVTRNCT